MHSVVIGGNGGGSGNSGGDSGGSSEGGDGGSGGGSGSAVSLLVLMLGLTATGLILLRFELDLMPKKRRGKQPQPHYASLLLHNIHCTLLYIVLPEGRNRRMQMRAA